jgi:methionyl-tRNA formyltransferase
VNRLNITILCSDPAHPVNAFLEGWIGRRQDRHQISLVRSTNELVGGDILFLVSCSEVLTETDRRRFKVCLVLHASDLPRDRGWSPHVWSIIEGEEELTLTLLEAGDTVDSGPIWTKMTVPIPKHALWDEINASIFQAELALMDYAIREFHTVEPQPQDGSIEPTYRPRRKPEHSKIDACKTLESQFDLIRVCDPHRFPAYFDLRGYRYKLVLEKIDEQ